MHIYPASMSPLPQPMMVPLRWQPLRVVAAVLCFVAMVLILAALFVPLYSGELTLDPEFGDVPPIEITYTAWSAEFNDASMPASPGEVTKVGYPMVFGIVILATAACACWYAATPSASRAAGRAAGVTTAVAGAFLIGTVWTIALLVTNAVDAILLYGTMNPGFSTEATYLVGYWLLLTAAFLGLGGGVLSLLPARQATWSPAGPYPTGQPVVHALDPATGQPLPGAPVAPYVSVDPLTGQPIQQNGQPPTGGLPVAQPPAAPWPAQPSPAAGHPAPPWPAQPTSVDPLTGQPIPPPAGEVGQSSVAGTPAPWMTQPGQSSAGSAGAAAPWTGQVGEGVVAPWAGQVGEGSVAGQPVGPVGSSPAVGAGQVGQGSVVGGPGVVASWAGQVGEGSVVGQSVASAAGGTDSWAGQGSVAGAPAGGPDPWVVPAGPGSVAGEPVPSAGVPPQVGEPSPAGGVPVQPEATAVDPLTGQPFSPPAVLSGNGAPPAIVLPEPPAPEEPKGPAIPASEDPLAEPPKS